MLLYGCEAAAHKTGRQEMTAREARRVAEAEAQAAIGAGRPAVLKGVAEKVIARGQKATGFHRCQTSKGYPVTDAEAMALRSASQVYWPKGETQGIAWKLGTCGVGANGGAHYVLIAD